MCFFNAFSNFEPTKFWVHKNMQMMCALTCKLVKADPQLANFRHGIIFHENLFAYLCSVGQIMHFVFVMYNNLGQKNKYNECIMLQYWKVLQSSAKDTLLIEITIKIISNSTNISLFPQTAITQYPIFILKFCFSPNFVFVST